MTTTQGEFPNAVILGKSDHSDCRNDEILIAIIIEIDQQRTP